MTDSASKALTQSNSLDVPDFKCGDCSSNTIVKLNMTLAQTTSDQRQPWASSTEFAFQINVPAHSPRELDPDGRSLEIR